MNVSQLNVAQATEALQLIETILNAPNGLPESLLNDLRRQAALLRQQLSN
jgi:hypothetical protein